MERPPSFPTAESATFATIERELLLCLGAIAKTGQSRSKEKESINRYEPAQIQKARCRAFARNPAAAKATSSRHRENRARTDRRSGTSGNTGACRSGVATSCRSTDLVVSEDPLLLRSIAIWILVRKHAMPKLLSQSRFDQQSEGAAATFWELAQFGLAAGTAARFGWKNGGHAGSEAIAAEIAAIRGAIWARWTNPDQRLLVLRIESLHANGLLSRRAARRISRLSEETMGLLLPVTPSRTLTGIESRDWNQVWSSSCSPTCCAWRKKNLPAQK